MISSQYTSETVLAAAMMTLGITVGLTVYALTTKSDFTMMGGAMFIFTIAFIMMGLLMWLMGAGRVAEIIYCTIGVILYGFYLIYDV